MLDIWIDIRNNKDTFSTQTKQMLKRYQDIYGRNLLE